MSGIMNVTVIGSGGPPRPELARASSAVGRANPARIKQVAAASRNLALVSIDLMFCFFVVVVMAITEVQPEIWAEVTRKSGE